MVDTRKVKFARGIKNTAGFFTLLYAVVMLAYLIGVAFFFNNLEEVDAVFITGILLDAVEHLVLAIALFTATTPKWLWFPIGAFALAKGYLLYDFVTIFANNDYNINLVTRSDVYVVCTSLGYIILFVMLFAKGFAKSAWLIPAALISVQDFVFSLESGKGLPDYIELIKSGNNLIGIMLLLSFVGNVIFVISTFLICLYVGKYSKQRLLFKRIESIPSAPAASEPEVPLTNTVTNGSVNANTAPKTTPSTHIAPSSPTVDIDSKLGIKSDEKPAFIPSVTDDTTVTLDDSLAAEIESNLGGSSPDDTSSEEENLASEIDKLMGN